MPDRFPLKPLWNRRQLLKLGLLGIGVTGAAFGLQQFVQQRRSLVMVKIPPLPDDMLATGNSISPMTVLRDFDYGTVKRENGRTIREFRIKAGTSTIQLNSAVSFITWNYNDRVPGPTLRATQGDRIRVVSSIREDMPTPCTFAAFTLPKQTASNPCTMVRQRFTSLMLNRLASICTTAISPQ